MISIVYFICTLDSLKSMEIYPDHAELQLQLQFIRKCFSLILSSCSREWIFVIEILIKYIFLCPPQPIYFSRCGNTKIFYRV